MPETDPTTTTEVLQTLFIGLQLLVLTAAAVFGRHQLNEAKDLREAQTRPFVVIDLGSSAHTLFDLVVKNIGPTLARDVRFEFDPPIRKVTVTYTDQTGTRNYEEKIDLDFGLYWDRFTVNRRDVHDLYKQLETIAKEIRNWRPNLGRGLLAVTTADVEARNAEALEQLEEHRAEQARDAEGAEDREEHRHR